MPTSERHSARRGLGWEEFGARSPKMGRASVLSSSEEIVVVEVVSLV